MECTFKLIEASRALILVLTTALFPIELRSTPNLKWLFSYQIAFVAAWAQSGVTFTAASSLDGVFMASKGNPQWGFDFWDNPIQ